jgi:predicted nucleic-acid-binding Zn-ribbon protein
MDPPTRRFPPPDEEPPPEHPTRRLGPLPRSIRRPPSPVPPTGEHTELEFYEGPPETAVEKPSPAAAPVEATYPCPKCGGTEVGASVHTHGSFYLQRYFGFLDWRSSDVGAWVCTDCGYTEFYAIDPANLRGD